MPARGYTAMPQWRGEQLDDRKAARVPNTRSSLGIARDRAGGEPAAARCLPRSAVSRWRDETAVPGSTTAGIEDGDRRRPHAAVRRTRSRGLAAHSVHSWLAGRMASIRQLPESPGTRSEEHTSELQSLMRISYAVFCLKKKHTYKQ